MAIKVGVRKPSIKKSIKARTTGRVKRQLRSSIDPTYGKKGMGWIKDPKKAAYNTIYRRTTVSAKNLVNTAGYSTERQEKAVSSFSFWYVLIMGSLIAICGFALIFAVPIIGIFFLVLGIYVAQSARHY